MEKGTEKILKYFPELGEKQIRALDSLGDIYREWNAKINVISRKDIEELYEHHILHSLAIAAYIREFMPVLYASATAEGSRAGKILDLGTGGGFPGIPLAIVFPGIEFTLCDSIGKKLKVAAAAAEGAGLDNVSIIHSRAEDIKESYDYVVSRAVTSLDNFLPWIKGKYTRGILYLKGGDLVEEITVGAMRNKLKMSDISVRPVSRWFSEEYFSEKKVVFICKSN